MDMNRHLLALYTLTLFEPEGGKIAQHFQNLLLQQIATLLLNVVL